MADRPTGDALEKARNYRLSNLRQDVARSVNRHISEWGPGLEQEVAGRHRHRADGLPAGSSQRRATGEFA
jgi:hypothetical protein